MSFWDIPEDIVDAAGSVVGDVVDAAGELFDGPEGLIGVMTAGAALYVAGPNALIPAFVAGKAIGSALIEHREMSGDEEAFAEVVFGKNILPPRERIILTNLSGIKTAAFVCPNVNGQILVNIGNAYDNPLTHVEPAYPSPGKLFIHELTHVLQVHRSQFTPGLVCQGIYNKISDADYAPGNLKDSLGDYNLEQQATVVDEWFAPSSRGPGGYAPKHPAHPFYRYIVEDVRRERMRPSISSLHPRTDEGATSLYLIGSGEKVWSNFWPAGDGLRRQNKWAGWFPVAHETFSKGAPVFALHPRTDEGATSLFTVGTHGRVRSTFWPTADGEWAEWFPVGDDTFPVGAPVSALHPRSDEGATSLYVVHRDGKVRSTFWPAADNKWAEWFPVGDKTFPKGAQISALHPRTDEGATSLFAIDLDGKVWSNFWPQNSGLRRQNKWSGWFTIGTKEFVAGAPVVALHPRTDEGATSLFTVGTDGKVWSTYWPTADNEWAEWFPIGDDTFPVGAPISALHPRSDEGATSLYVVDRGGKVRSTFWPTPDNHWAAWYTVGDHTFPVGAAISAVHPRSDEGATSLYVGDDDGRVWSSFWPAANNEWAKWFPVGDRIF